MQGTIADGDPLTFQWVWVGVGSVLGVLLSVYSVFVLYALLDLSSFGTLLFFLGSFFVTAFVVAFYSPGSTILEPAMAAILVMILDALLALAGFQAPFPLIAVIVAAVLAFAILLASPLRGADLVSKQLKFILRVLPSAVLIFADTIGIGGSLIAGTWTNDLTLIDVNTGLRPLSTKVTGLLALPAPVTTLPYFHPATAYVLDGVTYHKQQTPSTWKGSWEKGASTVQEVTAKWGDNLISQRLTENSVIRIEMVLSKALTTPLKSYTMKSLYGTRENEIFGTDGTTHDNRTAFVFASNARLKIQKLDSIGNPVGAPLYNQTL